MPLSPTSGVAELANALNRLSQLVGAIGGLQPQGRIEAHEHREIRPVTALFERINQTIERGIAAGHITPAQERSIAENFERIAAALEKGAGAHATPAKSSRGKAPSSRRGRARR